MYFYGYWQVKLEMHQKAIEMLVVQQHTAY